MNGSEGVKDSLGPWLPLFADYEITSLPYDDVIHGRLAPGLGTDHPAVVSAAESWPGRLHVDTLPGAIVEVALVRPKEAAPPLRVWLHLVLLVLTFLTVTVAGALLAGSDPVADGWLRPDPGLLLTGLPFSLTLMGILGAHEAGHWFAAWRHGVRAGLPYFIPVPPHWSVIGTFGAFLRVQGPPVRRKVLFDIGVAGPLASFVLGAAALYVGLGWSQPSGYAGSTLLPFLVQFGATPIGVGSNILGQGMAWAVFPNHVAAESILLHPVAFAGWLGLLLTALNLLPFGQLDGGHIGYGLLGDGQRKVAWGALLLLLPLALLWWGWAAWAVIALVLGRGRLRHPEVIQPTEGLGPGRVLVALLAALVFAVTFIPVPVRVFGG